MAVGKQIVRPLHVPLGSDHVTPVVRIGHAVVALVFFRLGGAARFEAPFRQYRVETGAPQRVDRPAECENPVHHIALDSLFRIVLHVGGAAQIFKIVAERGQRREPFVPRLVEVVEGSGMDHRVSPVVLAGIHEQRQSGLFVVVQAADGVRPRPRPVQCRQQQSGQNRDDRCHDEQLNEGKRP